MTKSNLEFILHKLKEHNYKSKLSQRLHSKGLCSWWTDTTCFTTWLWNSRFTPHNGLPFLIGGKTIFSPFFVCETSRIWPHTFCSFLIHLPAARVNSSSIQSSISQITEALFGFKFWVFYAVAWFLQFSYTFFHLVKKRSFHPNQGA